MNLDPELTVCGLVVHAVDVPMNRPLKTGGGEVGSAAMVLIDLLTEDGYASSSDAAGIGISWDVGAVQRFSVGEP